MFGKLLSWTEEAQPSVTKFIDMFDINPVKPKALALVQQAEASLLNKGSCFARALGVTKFIIVRDMHLVTLCCAT